MEQAQYRDASTGFVSTVLVLLGLVTSEALQDDQEYLDVTRDVTEECASFGEVPPHTHPLFPKHTSSKGLQKGLFFTPRPGGPLQVVEVHIPRPLAGDTSGVGKVFVEFGTETAAVACGDALRGRDFDGRPLQCAFLDEARWDDGKLDEHSQPT